jgi:SPP1 gp7 family putative phage head morphogenesis protein
VKDTKARIQTIMRTSTFEAINEARMEYFTDPALGGFVEALEYSAIMDDRTTEICSEMDGKIYPADSEVWQTLAPPNHFNALASGTMITTDCGHKRIESVRIGDRVLTHRGRFMPVYSIMAKNPDGNRIRLLHADSGRVLAITDEHPVLTASGWKRADDINVGDVLFEHCQNVSGLEDCAIGNPQDFPSLFDQPPVSYEVGISAAGVGVVFSVNLKDDEIIRESEVCDVAANRMLEFKSRARLTQDFGHDPFVHGGGRLPCRASADSSRLGYFFAADRVVCDHARGVSSIEGAGLLSESKCPMVGAAGPVYGVACVGNADLVNAAANSDTVALAPVAESGLSDSDAALDVAQGLASSPVAICNQILDGGFVRQVHNGFSGFVRAAVVKIAEVDYTHPVWNIAVQDDESYVANGIVVHNCRSLLIAVTARDNWTESPAPTVTPQKGFSRDK